MEAEPLIIDFKEVNAKDIERIKSAIEETDKLTKIYLSQPKLSHPALAMAAKELNLPFDLNKELIDSQILDYWAGIGEGLGAETVRETLQKALKLNPQQRLTSIEYNGCEWMLYQPDKLAEIPEENRMKLTHVDVNRVYVACGGTLVSSTK